MRYPTCLSFAGLTVQARRPDSSPEYSLSPPRIPPIESSDAEFTKYTYTSEFTVHSSWTYTWADVKLTGLQEQAHRMAKVDVEVRHV
ncbi:hypothetical protein CLAFUW4_00779 [Fulvia fulva]|uniref:Uncharacterized protein n=1 Tax=Passalora fulva TaxID=5499 RepID=A0A9Q8L5G2_PASFU|nr:uncharacterized protein CLAFUR5_00782 [Fulvia fulva]KAK4635436.1 hypothetical protein CLAFUR4_00780 [Fulvia fulva]KAK4636990.1 hypothetical protein CLAFUR0_00781 [Fulvia fulva]UJO11230.1 hypothetical protein CLAFUR5_00782 [Fulvia fulva]WPV09811.1 hypothetical protein CLAFUW4_00779 [Fulvia fulva]WPV24208.1 hypothetical protein CLAFUW7_00784 [Fulvia fulva]